VIEVLFAQERSNRHYEAGKSAAKHLLWHDAPKGKEIVAIRIIRRAGGA
jgi:hypothetical protein